MQERLFSLKDMVKVDCHDCAGCSDCCRGMGDTIILDPLDAVRLKKGLGKNMQELLAKEVELHVQEGIILPNLAMDKEREACCFLDENGRCTIHAIRPGLCRAFPLGRNYEDGVLKYFLLQEECPKQNRSKMKIEKWLDTPDLKNNQRFLVEWHYLIKEIRQLLPEKDDAWVRNVSVKILENFYLQDFASEETFYEEIHERLEAFRQAWL